MKEETRPPYGIGVDISKPHGLVLSLMRTALHVEGFKILTEIDVRATLTENHNGDFPHYVVLGACHRTLAHQALKIEPDYGLMMLSNVVVYEMNAHTRVSALDPAVQLGITGRNALFAILDEARQRLIRAIESVVRDNGHPHQEVG